jgi:hypothetical protein
MKSQPFTGCCSNIDNDGSMAAGEETLKGGIFCHYFFTRGEVIGKSFKKQRITLKFCKFKPYFFRNYLFSI